MLTLPKTLHTYFFGEEEVTLHDLLWFYGMQALLISVSVPFIIDAFVNLFKLI